MLFGINSTSIDNHLHLTDKSKRRRVREKIAKFAVKIKFRRNNEERYNRNSHSLSTAGHL